MSHWYYNTSSGDLANEGGPIGTLGGLLNTNLPGSGWHELNVPGTATEAQAAAAAMKEFPGAAKPTTSTGTALAQQLGSQTGIPNPLTGLAAIGDFFGRLTSANLWERVGEVVLGIILIAVGLAKLTGAVPIATAIASKVP